MTMRRRVRGFNFDDKGMLHTCTFDVLVSNDEFGRTLSIHDGERMFTIPFEQIADLLEKPRAKGGCKS